MLSLEQRLDKIEEVIKKPSFRQNKGLGNEVGYYIFDYPAEQELVVRERIEYIRQKNEEAIDGFRIVVFDLYDIITVSYTHLDVYKRQCFAHTSMATFARYKLGPMPAVAVMSVVFKTSRIICITKSCAEM